MNFFSNILGASGSNVDYGDTFQGLWESTGFFNLQWGNVVMILIACFFLFLAIKKKFEPLLLVGIAFGMLLSNIPGPVSDWIYHPDLWVSSTTVDYGEVLQTGGLIDILYIGVKTSVYPCLIFLGVGAMTDFGPLIANPKSFLLGAAAQFGIYGAYFLAILMGFNGRAAAAISIIGGADGPTSIFLAGKLGQTTLMGPIAVAAYSYMALVPIIQPPIMRALTTEEERKIKMEQPRAVSKEEKIIFPVAVSIIVILLIPDTAPLIGMLMLGNLFRECGVTERLSETAQNNLCNIVTIFLGVSVGCKAKADTFLTLETVEIIILGLLAFCLSTVGGLLIGKVMCKLSGGKINPLIGSAGVSAVPMAARVSQIEGQKANPANFLLMHAMGPNVAGVIGSAVAAGFMLKVFGA